jgi:ketosteroid isomerase-like protein
VRRILSACIIASTLVCGAAAAEVPAYIGKYVTSPQDTTAINKVIDDFQAAIKTKDRKLLSTLVLDSNILFDAPMSPEDVAYVRDKHDVTFNGMRAGGYNDFVRFIGMEKGAFEEKFYNVKITQDGHVAWVMFDYEFIKDGKTQNYGVETWQMMKAADSKWKIASVMWTMNRPPK